MRNPFQKIAVGNMGEEELERVQRTVLTRDETRAEADLLFGEYAKDMRKEDRALLEKLFAQTPAAVTMAPNLQKNASKRVGMLKLASTLACGPDGGENWLTQFEGTSLLPQAIALEEQNLQMEQEDIQGRIEEQHRYSQQDQERNARYQKGDQLRMEKRVLALELAKQKAGLSGGEEGAEPPPEGHPEEQGAKEPQQPPQEPPQAPPQAPGAQKTASITPRVDAFFEKLSAPTDAQRRYPELMKVAGGAGTVKTPNTKARVTTDRSGPTPTKSDLSGGSA
jgi:hypothetical protein